MIQTCRCDYFMNSFNSHMLCRAILLCANCVPVPLLRFSWTRPVRSWLSLSSLTQSLEGAAVVQPPLLCTPDPCSYRRTPVADPVVTRLLKEAPDEVPPQVHYLRLFPESRVSLVPVHWAELSSRSRSISRVPEVCWQELFFSGHDACHLVPDFAIHSHSPKPSLLRSLFGVCFSLILWFFLLTECFVFPSLLK